MSGGQFLTSGFPDYLSPCVGQDGEWGTAGGLAIKESLSRGSMVGVMDLLDSMDGRGLADVLREAGFAVSAGMVEMGRGAILAGIQDDLNEAIESRVDGFGLAGARAAQGIAVGDGLDFATMGFGGDAGALRAIQDVMRSEAVSVDLLGGAAPGARGSLLFVAGQALEMQVQGFGFDGIEGKYAVPLSMGDVVGLHGDAARSMAVDSARTALGVWVDGGKVEDLSEWVPDSVQRLLNGSLSVSAASAVVHAIEGGLVGRHASEIGVHGFTRLLSEQGYDVNALSVGQQAEELGLVMVEPDRRRGVYAGPMVGEDHRAGLVKYAREKAVELPFKELAAGQAKPKVGDTVRMGYKEGALAVSVAERVKGDGVGR